ncbi:MAG TPA: AraC family transcriptional regulator [Kofleriaceae bacterium]|nr:AraC family transcriptional regulator [Kofleriaceae bacterium]
MATLVAPVARLIARGRGWTVSEHVCGAGPRDQPFEEAHSGFAIAVVVEGTFTYHTETGRAVMHPGALLLGNPGARFECRHEHATGDRCLACHFDDTLLDDDFRFRAAMIPAGVRRAPSIAVVEALAARGDAGALEDAVVRLLEDAIATEPTRVAMLSARDVRRISEIVRHLEHHSCKPVDLDALAALAGTSKFHFARMFRSIVGMSPYQFVIALRMRRAAVRLASELDAVATIAFDVGFGDLSTFNHRFLDVFGMTPTAYRKRHGRSRPG